MNKLTNIFNKVLLAYAILYSANVKSQITIGGSSATTFEKNYASPQTYEIGGIKAVGIQFLDPNSLISITGLKVGDQIAVPGDDISGAVKKLWEQGILGDIKVIISKIEGNYIFLEFHLKERPRLSKFEFEGVRKSEADDIREDVSLVRGKTITDALLNNTKTKVEKFFVQKGFRNVDVILAQKEDPLLPNNNILTIKVNKKDKVKIEDIVFSGNTVVSSDKLKRKMKDTKVSKPYRIFKASKLLDGAYAKDKQALTDYYNTLGYRDVIIESDTFYDINNERVKIEIQIKEGEQYKFGDITWSGNYLYSSDTLSGILNLKKGDVYNKDVLTKRLNYNPNGLDITSLYMDDGYLFFNIIPVEVRADSNYIDLEMRMYEGEQATVRNIIISGNSVTNDHVIRRELYVYPGQKFSRTSLIRTQQSLSQLGYFNPETIGINPIPDPQTGEVDIEFSLEEKPSNQITLSGGWGGWQGFVGTLGLVYTNFSARKIFNFREYSPLPSGDGQRLSVQANSTGRRYQSYSLSFTEPWLGGRKPNSLTVSINKTVMNQLGSGVDSSGLNPVVGALKINGINIYLQQRLQKPDNFFNLTNSFGINQYKNEGTYSLPISDEDYSTTVFDGTFNSLTYSITLARNDIDNPTYPRKGSSFSLSTKFTPPYSMFREPIELGNGSVSEYLKEKYKWVEYHKWNLDMAFYTPLSKDKKRRLVLMNKANFGVIGNYSKGLGTGPFERFVLGGSGMAGFGMTRFMLGQDYIGLRGYEDNSVLLNQFPSGSSAPMGGIAFSKLTSEVRFLVSDNPMATIFGLGFFEAGNNYHSYKELDPYNLRKSFGCGIRLFMPMFGGLIGYDIAFPLDDPRRTNPFDGGPRGHFSIGMPLR